MSAAALHLSHPNHDPLGGPMNRDTHGRFTRSPQTFAERVEAEVWADLRAQTAAVPTGLTYQERAAFLTVAFDTAAERLEWLGAS